MQINITDFYDLELNRLLINMLDCAEGFLCNSNMDNCDSSNRITFLFINIIFIFYIIWSLIFLKFDSLYNKYDS
jgi:hypothetical protein